MCGLGGGPCLQLPAKVTAQEQLSEAGWAAMGRTEEISKTERLRGKQGSFVIFRRGAECAPRERSPGWGGGTRACIFDAAGSTVHGPAPEGTSRTGQKSAFDGKEISGRLYPNANLRAAWTGCSRTENRAKESVQVLNRF